MSPATRIRLPFDGPFTLHDIRKRGLTRHALSGWLARGEVRELSPGVYVPAPLAADTAMASMWPNWLTRDGLRILTIAGAAEFHQIARPPQLPPAHVAGRQRRVIPDRFLEQHGPWSVPTPAWTAVQLARWQRVEHALIPLDAALHAGVDRADLQAAVDAMESWPGARRLGTALRLADAAAESPLESLSRGHIHAAKLPMPKLQVELWVQSQRFRVDFMWPQFMLIGEADGMGKYTGRDVVLQEKRRQSLLQSIGYRVVRWTWADVFPDPHAWLAGLGAQCR